MKKMKKSEKLKFEKKQKKSSKGVRLRDGSKN